MAKIIIIETEATGKIKAELRENENPITVQAIWDALPIEAKVDTWGDEIYFSIPVDLKEENSVSVVKEGNLGYWPKGRCFCIFFGPTPMSKGEEIIPASPVNLFGKVMGDARVFKKVFAGAKIKVMREE